jgi:hypothetical protein
MARTVGALGVAGSMLLVARLPAAEDVALREANAELDAGADPDADAARAAAAVAASAEKARLEDAGLRVPQRKERSGAGCQPIVVTDGPGPADDVTVRWYDASCRPRTAVLASPEKRDEQKNQPAGGGYIRELEYENGDQVIKAVGTGVNDWKGFGYVVAHYPLGPRGTAAGERFDAAETVHAAGTHLVTLRGPHHVIYRASWRLSPGGPLDVTAEWLFATGRDAPLFTITYDARPAGPGVLRADSRAPYGDMAFEGDADAPIGGVAWGDRYRFTSLHDHAGSALSFASSWDYRAPNIVAFDRIWSRDHDAEMGLVATARWTDKPQGGDYGPGALQQLWGTAGRGLPTDWAWPYQIDQYDLPWSDSSHRLAWGMTFGAVGQPSYTAWDRVLSGYPFQSYSVHWVVGPRDASAVMAEVEAMETTLTTDIRATRGHVVSEAPGGIARTDLVALALPGWDPTYATWTIDADGHGGGIVGGHFKVPDHESLYSPMIRILGWSKPGVTKVTLNRDTFPVGDILASVDAEHTLWITLPTVIHGDQDFSIE